MQTTPVHVAVLLVTNAHTAADEATVKLIIDRLGLAGHRVVECEVLRDSAQLVRGQFLKWIADNNIDVVLAIAGIDTESTSAALAPLITKPLDGFSELVRMISFEEIGTGAMLVDVTAAQCSSTFVFVLPASNGAVRSALDRILLPQLDIQTKPRNLVSRMPRLKAVSAAPPTQAPAAPLPAVPKPPVVAERMAAVPTAIPSEKTSVGVGAAQLRAPSQPTQIGPAPAPKPPIVATIPSTPKAVLDDEPTIPVEAKPPRKTPVPSISAVDPSVVDDSWAAPMPEPAPTPAPAIAAERPEPWIKPKHVMPPLAPEPAKPGVIPSVPRTPPAGLPIKAATPPVGLPIKAATPVAAVEAAPVARIALKPAPLPSIKPITSESAATASGASEARVVAKTPPVGTPVEGPPPAPRKRPPTDPPPLPLAARKRPPTDPPPNAKIIIDDDTLPIEDVTDLATPIVTGPRKAKVIEEPILPSARIGGPRGTTEGAIFDGRELAVERRQRKRSKLPFLIAFLAIVASAIVVLLVINFVGRGDGASSAAATPRPEPTPPPPVVVPPPVIELDAAVAVAQLEPDAAEPAPEPEPPPVTVVEPTPEPAKPPATPRKPPTTPRKPPATTAKPPVTPTATPRPPDPDPDPPPNPPVASGCDEVSCILEKYARPCCARFKPADTAKITPSGLPESLDKSMIRAGVDKVRPVIIRCGETSPAKGTVKVAVSVKPDGHVEGADVAGAPDPTLGACVAGAIKKTSFSRTQNGGTFTYPFVF
jgi:molybdopterin adenylyltransferase